MTQEVPAPARLGQARALLDLRQPDRAWIRLKDQIDTPTPTREAGQLAAEILLQRGSHDQARELLGRLLAENPGERNLQALWDRAAAPAPEIPSLQAWALDEVPPLQAGTDLAEALLLSGQTINARGLLERLRKAWPGNERIGDLLWAIEGDYAANEGLKSLVDRWGPVTLLPAGDADDEHTESITQESARKVALSLLDDLDAVAESASFPSLFRNAPPRAVLVDDPAPELTQSQRWQPFLELPTEDSLDPESGDTRIVRVLHRGSPGGIHRATPAVDEDFDLDEFRREMGMEIEDPRPVDRWNQPLEDEDDDRVVLRRRDPGARTVASAADPTDPTMTQVGREVAHLLGGKPPKTPQPPAGRPDPAADTPAPASPSEPDDVRLPSPEPPVTPVIRPATPPDAGWWPWALALAALLVVGGLPVGGLLIAWLLAG